MSLRDQILAANDLHSEEVDVTEEWGCKVFVRVMTPDDYDDWARVPAHSREMLVVQSAFDAEGIKVFQGGKWVEKDGKREFVEGDEALLAKKGHPALHKLFMAAARINKLSGPAEKKAE